MELNKEIFQKQKVEKTMVFRKERFKKDRLNNDRFKNDIFKNGRFKNDRFKNDKFKTDRFKNDIFKNSRFKNDRFKNDIFKNSRFKNDRFKNDIFKMVKEGSDKQLKHPIITKQVNVAILEAKSVAIMNNLQNSDDLLMGGSKLAVNDITEEPEIKILLRPWLISCHSLKRSDIIINLFSKKLNECVENSPKISGGTENKKVIPRLKQSSYEEVLTTKEVLNKLKEDEDKKKVKQTKGKRVAIPRKQKTIILSR
ncbi:unnamed protein product [Psylliodes chrysocephalus]|uniref:Uncharacterized protein n=1 Tax=Psylliodes chrysocephalus TaxID=3402493 RepID=A0A9P0GMB5_9CUCU|nr:unnamed protein product [Psylliodes chrysocephala]